MTGNDAGAQHTASGADQPDRDHRHYGAEMAIVIIDGEEVVAL